MDDAKRKRIAHAASIAFDKRKQHELRGMQDSPTDINAARQAAIEYAISETEMLEANAILRKEIES